MIGTIIKNLRKEKNLSLRSLAQSAGISKSTLSDVENSNNNPSIKTLEKIAIALDVSVKDLLTSEEKVEVAINSMTTISEMALKALSYNPIDSAENGLNPISPLFENENFSVEEQNEIANFIKYIITKRS
ncbi:helix-turn-helix domain-containing protein [Clostridium estertheticum]|uniref:HTH cro/C1-type domain-containing protein n=1 Tax=Clostridium estertheticum subsp. estertheticum TaxID=1552 RepID=A0A1J0GKS2_9CLOT|nr:helix-turn-helix transcriptional regulator [Clostridium estertheticum]APC41560.1 hypothetical protein A7L45_16480 [Clostridium estertheticum subsp. estertheticum]